MIRSNQLRHLMLFVVATSLLFSVARAAEHPNDRKGLIVGFNTGGANAVLEYDRGGATVERDIEGGIGGALRLAFGLSDSFILGLEGHGMTKKDGPEELEVGSGLVTLTWYPGSGGFFLRAGAGTAQATVKLPAPTGADWVEREGDAGLPGIGYEWRLGRQFALGIALDAVGVEFQDLPDFQDTVLGYGSASLQLNWYL
jgi:hypothetical protein